MATTPLRNVRVDDDLWSAALERARQDGTTLSAVIVDRLREYADVGEPHPDPCPCGCHLGPA